MPKYHSKAIELVKDQYSMYLFDLHLYELSPFQNIVLSDYIYDLSNPVYRPIMIGSTESGYYVNNIGDVIGKKGNKLKPDIENTGYYRISGYYDKAHIHISIHREVAIAFIPNPENKPFVNHINGNKLCNWYKNLEWCTHAENMEHAVRTGLIDIRGEKHPENVYSEDQIRKACEMMSDPCMHIADITRVTGINRSILYSIRTGRSWVDVASEYDIIPPIKATGFDETNIETAVKLLATTDLGYNKISELTGIPYRTQIKIVNRSPKYINLSNKYNVSRNVKSRQLTS